MTRFRPVLIAAGLLIGALPTGAWAVTPESPEVVEVVNRALAYLEKAQPDSQLGAKCLVGLCMIKNNKGASHPSVELALKECATLAKSADAQDNYSTGLAIIFLCELDAGKHEQLIQTYLNSLLKRQQRGGGWGYPNTAAGDTSQVQYATLGIWTANAYGMQVEPVVIERLCAYLMRTQDPNGAWGYQAVDPNTYNRVQQPDVRHSLAAAGLGSLYICGDMLGITDHKQDKPDTGLPPALRIVETKTVAERRRAKSAVIDEGIWKRCTADGNAWFDRNFKIEVPTYTHYYLYAYERYASFRELAEGHFEKEPAWYQQVFDYLQRTQQPNGAWAGQTNETIATTFAVLFLSRSSKKTIQKIKDLGEGTLLGGMGLPTATADLQEKDGRVVESKLAGSVDELLAIIEDPENPQLNRLAAGGGLALDGDVTKRAGQVVRLRSLVSAGSFESRLVAVKTLSKARDLDNVPILLYALTDPDKRIVVQADKGLRFISRKFAGVGLPEDPTPPQARDAHRAWKVWFLSVRPDAELID